MKSATFVSFFVAAAMLTPVIGYSAESREADRHHPKAFVKDSAITVKIKAKLAAEHPSSMARIHVDTDAHGVVWLSGTARSHEDMERAVSIAKETEGVMDVKNHMRIKKDD